MQLAALLHTESGCAGPLGDGGSSHGLAHSQQQPEFALLIALGFNALLRTSEMLSLSHQHVVPHRGGKGMSLIIPGSKTSQGNPQVLLVLDDALIACATSVLRPQEKALLWPHGPHCFRKLFAKLLCRLGFAEDDYTPYSLRRGGATWHFQSTLSVDATVARGRWSCSKTAKQYVICGRRHFPTGASQLYRLSARASEGVEA